MIAFIDSGGAHTTGMTYHPIDGFKGTVQDHTAYLSNGKNITNAAGKVVINQITLVSIPTPTTILVAVRTIDDSQILMEWSTGQNVGLNRYLLSAPVEVDTRVAFRVTGNGQFLFDFDIAQI